MSPATVVLPFEENQPYCFGMSWGGNDQQSDLEIIVTRTV